MDPWAEALGRVLTVLDRADRYQAWVDKKPGRTQADLARKEKLTRARVSQILRLRCLPDRIVEDLRQADRKGPVPREVDLRKVAGLPRGEQWARYEEVLRERGTGKAARAARPRGDLRFDFERARCWRAELEADHNLRLADIARREGYTPSRVSQIMNLLDLAPAIIEVLAVEPSKKPKVLRRDIRRISWIQHHEEQLAEFEKVCPGLLAPR